MKYWLAAGLLLLGFGWLAYQGASIAAVQSTAVEDELNLRVVEPVLTRYNAQGQIESVLTAPDALDFGQSRPSIIDAPDIQWPTKQWTARSNQGEVKGATTLLIGDALAINEPRSQRLSAPLITQEGNLLSAKDGQLQAPDFTARAKQVTINTDTQIISLKEQVSSQLWPARATR